MKKILLIILFIALIARPTYIIATSYEKFFFPHYDNNYYQKLSEAYYNSQYAKKNSTLILVDEAFEAFAGGAFLRGLNPILIVHDHPPLGRYIISLSILLFQNEHAIVVLFFSLSILGLYLISKAVIKDSLFSLIPIVLYINEPLMLSKLIYTPVPEIIFLPFIIFSIYFFMKYIESNRLIFGFLTVILLGCLISSRFFAFGAVLVFSQLLFLILTRDIKKLIFYALLLPLSLVVLMLTYFRSIQDSSSLIEPFRIQKYILSYHSNKFSEAFTVFDLLLFNRWHTWWGNRAIITDPNWNILWPVSSALTGCLALLGILRKIKISKAEFILLLWVFSYLGMLTFGTVSVRYFVPLIPFLYILGISFILKYKLFTKFIK